MNSINYDDIIPKGVMFNLAQIEDMYLIKGDMAKKLISKGLLESVKVGTKTHITRAELIRYLEENTILRTQGEV